MCALSRQIGNVDMAVYHWSVARARVYYQKSQLGSIPNVSRFRVKALRAKAFLSKRAVFPQAGQNNAILLPPTKHSMVPDNVSDGSILARIANKALSKIGAAAPAVASLCARAMCRPAAAPLC